MDPVSSLVGLLVIVGTGALAKVGENIHDETVKQAQSLCSTLLQKFPNSPILQAIAAGQDIDYQQAVIDVEAIALDPEGAALLDQVRLLLDSNQELAAKVEALATQAKTENIQVAAKDFEAEELDAEVEQEISATQSQGTRQQIGFENVKIKGKATIKLNQQMN